MIHVAQATKRIHGWNLPEALVETLCKTQELWNIELQSLEVSGSLLQPVPGFSFKEKDYSEILTIQMADEAERKVELCTPRELDALVRDENGSLRLPADDYNEVIPGLLIGSKRVAMNKTALKEIGITHVLNAAEGKGFMLVDTSTEYYKDLDIKYFGLACSDDETTKISEYFDTASQFIDDAVTSGGKILVNCMKGFSRSSTLVIAYFMIKKRMTAQDATTFVRAKRKIGPNNNFLEQLCQLNDNLQKTKSE